ncbi:efflux RND transporter permease subunit [uncultured Dialister sp.]|uniref:efflux RND transporter permease subunit n=1 Tax=uncultured Dialister sp. TaxID=278064 RepID=UPI0026604BD9|nr:efflux RND transporter permease subunit [uncultured Dialister sp.]
MNRFNMTRYAVTHPIGIVMIVLFFVTLGLYSYYRIGVELYPKINTPYVVVSVSYSGADAESVEQQITKPVEDALSSVSNVKHITSKSKTGRSQVTLELNFDADVDAAAVDASQKVNAIRKSLPDDADDPVVEKRDMDAAPIIDLALVSSHPLDEMYSLADNTLTNDFTKADGVLDVELSGGRDKEIAVKVDRDRLSYYGISMNDIISALKRENKLAPSGSSYTDRRQTQIRLDGQYASVADIKQIHLTAANGESVPITVLGDVVREDKKVSRYARINGQDGIGISIYKNSNANLVSTADNVMQVLDQLRAEYPDYRFIVVNDSADYVRTALHNTLGTLIEGLFTTGLVLFLFLRGWRSAAAVMIAIPTSLIASFFAMYMAGFTFNMMSLMGMTLCIGILVDDSIVVLENIHRHLAMGENPVEAAVNGRMEIGMAAIAITLCDMVVYLPIAFMTSMTGQFFRQFGLTIVFASLFSLFVSFTLTPMLASRFFRNGLPQSHSRLFAAMDRVEDGVQRFYGEALHWSFSNKKKLFAGVALSLAIFTAMIPLGIIGREYMPRTDESGFNVQIKLPTDASVERTDKVTSQLEDYLSKVPEVTNYMAMVGGGNGVNSGRIRVSLENRQDRSRSIWAVTDEMRAWIAKNIKDGDVRIKEDQASVSGTSGGGLGQGGGAFRLELRGNNMEDLIKASEMAQDLIKNGNYGVTDVSSTYQEGLPELSIIPDREKMKFYGVTVGSLYDTLSSAISGSSGGVLPNDVKNNGNDTDINVYFRGGESYKKSDLAAVPMETKNGIVHISDVATIKDDVGPITINRTDKQRSIIIGGNPGSWPLSQVISEVTNDLNQAGLPKSVSFRFSGQADSMNESFTELLAALLMGMVLVYMILSVLYESVKTSFIRMFSLPFGLIGSLFFLFLMNDSLNIYSMIGIIVMDGVVAKNGTLLLDYTLTLMHRDGMKPKEAVIEAGKTRLRPILMTTFTMIVGMIPTALAVTAGSETRSSMAWVIIGGLLTSTVFTLLVLPMIFLFFEEHPMVQWIRKKVGV